MKRDTLLSLDTCFSVLGALAILSAGVLAVNPNRVPFAAIASCAVSGLVLLALGRIVEQARRRAARREGLRQIAERLGLSYQPSSHWNVLGWSPSFYLTHVRWDREGLNVLKGSLDGSDAAIFDYCYQTGAKTGGKTRVPYWSCQTVFGLKSPRLHRSHVGFVSGAWHDERTQMVFGPSCCDDVVAQVRPDLPLPDGYRVVGENGDSLEELAGRLLPFLCSGVSVEVGDEVLLVYRRDTLTEPDNVEELIRTGLQIYSVLSSKTPRDEPLVALN